VIENCAIATMDGSRHDQAGAEYRSGHLTVTGDRITAVGEGPAPDVPDGARRIDGTGCLATPGLVNTHHHLYQWLTQGRAQQSVLFDWLTELPGLGQDRRRAGPRRGYRGPGLAGPVRVHHQHRPPLHLPAGSWGRRRRRAGRHCVQLDEAAIRRFAATGTSVAHCRTSNARLGAGIAPVRDLLRAGATVGLGVDGAASSEGTSLAGELRQALLAARVREGPGPSALTARQALWLGTRGGARCLGRDDETGALRPGLLADIALWRLDTLAHDAIGHGPGDGDWSGDPVAALVLGPPAPLEFLLVGGTPVVEGGELRTADPAEAAREVRAARRRLADPG
jgi:cytosine/adenosine deaminase-related metal-dependent hydrolase